MASSMARAAKVPARPWPLMKTALYRGGSSPTRPKRLPCSTAPKAAGERAGQSPEAPPCQPHSQFMNQMVAMVTEKKRSRSIGTLTSTAVRVKSSRMKSRLPVMRTPSETLRTEGTRVRPGRWGVGGATSDLRYRMELSSVKSSSGSWDSSVIQLLKWYFLPSTSVLLAKADPFSRSWKYCREPGSRVSTWTELGLNQDWTRSEPELDQGWTSTELGLDQE